jgi:hypothetical protein
MNRSDSTAREVIGPEAVSSVEKEEGGEALMRMQKPSCLSHADEVVYKSILLFSSVGTRHLLVRLLRSFDVDLRNCTNH